MTRKEAIAAPTRPGPKVDAVVIGRNEGDRLNACLRSLQGFADHLVYVDSGSGDGSPEAARALGAVVVALDMSQPFTAARARNAGLAALPPPTGRADYVQFVDGDCAVHDQWIVTAVAFLRDHPEVAVVCGRRRERFPEASVYNRLCDEEWDTPVGEAQACGGDALMRRDAVEAAGGYRETLIAGEEPELCLRLRRAGWKVWRLDAEMTLHDAAITRFAQWWRRSRRAGHAFAEGSALHGDGPERHWRRETRRALFWGAGLPLIALLLGVLHPVGMLLWLAYPAQIARLALRDGGRWADWQRGFFVVLGKFAEARGALGYYLGALRGRRTALIEYK